MTIITLEAVNIFALADEAGVDDILTGIGIAPNLATLANAHEYGSTDSVV